MIRPLRSYSLKLMHSHTILLLGLAALICVLRINYYDWPLNRDVTLYAVMSHEFLEGKDLYTDFWDIKPPAIFLSYGAAEAVFGYGQGTLYLLNLGCALSVLFGVYACGCASGYGWSARIWAALFWTALSGDVALQMHDANTEAFMNAFVIWAFFLFIAPPSKNFGYERAVLIGLLFAWASLYKQVIVFIPFLLSIGHIGLPPAGTSRCQALIHVLIITAMGVLLWGLVTAYMAYTGRFQVFYDTIVTHAQAYAGKPSGNVAAAVSSNNLLQSVHRFKVVIPLVIFTSLGVVWGLIRTKSRIWVLISLYAVGAFISIVLPGKFYRHYFQIGLPSLVVAAGWTTMLFSRGCDRWKLFISHLCAAAVLCFIVANQIPFYTTKPEVKLKNTYAELYLVTQKLGKRVPSILNEDETMFQWGAESGLYFYSKRRPPASINGWSHFNRTFGEEFTQQTLSKLKRSPPDLVFIPKYFMKIRPDHPVQKWIIDNFSPVDGLSAEEAKYYLMMARRGSALESRLAALPTK